MRIDVLRFNGQLEVPGMATSSRYRITSAEGFNMTVMPHGILARHAMRPGADLLVPWAKVESCDLMPVQLPFEDAAEETEPESPQAKRGPGRPKRVA